MIKKVQQLIFGNELETVIELQFDNDIQQKHEKCGVHRKLLCIYMRFYEAIGSRKKICRWEENGEFNTNYIPCRNRQCHKTKHS